MLQIIKHTKKGKKLKELLAPSPHKDLKGAKRALPELSNEEEAEAEEMEVSKVSVTVVSSVKDEPSSCNYQILCPHETPHSILKDMLKKLGGTSGWSKDSKHVVSPALKESSPAAGVAHYHGIKQVLGEMSSPATLIHICEPSSQLNPLLMSAYRTFILPLTCPSRARLDVAPV